MRIHVYTHVHNEELMMPYFLRHYSTFADAIYVYDAHSTDLTRDMVMSCPKAELHDFNCDEVDDQAYLDLANSFYKKSRGDADWIIVVDADEFIYHQDIRSVLGASGDSVIRTTGYMMVSDQFPTTGGQIYEEVVDGYQEQLYSKPSIFRPEIDINFGWGKHTCTPSPEVKIAEDGGIALLHCVYLGLDHTLARHRSRFLRMCQFNKDNDLGVQYVWTPEVLTAKYEEARMRSARVPGL